MKVKHVAYIFEKKTNTIIEIIGGNDKSVMEREIKEIDGYCDEFGFVFDTKDGLEMSESCQKVLSKSAK